MQPVVLFAAVRFLVPCVRRRRDVERGTTIAFEPVGFDRDRVVRDGAQTLRRVRPDALEGPESQRILLFTRATISRASCIAELFVSSYSFAASAALI